MSIKDIILTVRCVACKKTRELKASEGPHNDIPLCSCGMPMTAVKAKSVPLREIRKQLTRGRKK